jgi:hypothetical protein
VFHFFGDGSACSPAKTFATRSGVPIEKLQAALERFPPKRRHCNTFRARVQQYFTDETKLIERCNTRRGRVDARANFDKAVRKSFYS